MEKPLKCIYIYMHNWNVLYEIYTIDINLLYRCKDHHLISKMRCIYIFDFFNISTLWKKTRIDRWLKIAFFPSLYIYTVKLRSTWISKGHTLIRNKIKFSQNFCIFKYNLQKITIIIIISIIWKNNCNLNYSFIRIIEGIMRKLN